MYEYLDRPPMDGDVVEYKSIPLPNLKQGDIHLVTSCSTNGIYINSIHNNVWTHIGGAKNWKVIKTKPGKEAQVGDTVITIPQKSDFTYHADNGHKVKKLHTIEYTTSVACKLSGRELFVNKNDFLVLCKKEIEYPLFMQLASNPKIIAKFTNIHVRTYLTTSKSTKASDFSNTAVPHTSSMWEPCDFTIEPEIFDIDWWDARFNAGLSIWATNITFSTTSWKLIVKPSFQGSGYKYYTSNPNCPDTIESNQPQKPYTIMDYTGEVLTCYQVVGENFGPSPLPLTPGKEYKVLKSKVNPEWVAVQGDTGEVVYPHRNCFKQLNQTQKEETIETPEIGSKWVRCKSHSLFPKGEIITVEKLIKKNLEHIIEYNGNRSLYLIRFLQVFSPLSTTKNETINQTQKDNTMQHTTIQQLLTRLFGAAMPTDYDLRPQYLVVAYNRDGSEMGTATANNLDQVKDKVADTPELWGCKVLTYKLDKEVSVKVPVKAVNACTDKKENTQAENKPTKNK